MSLNKKYIFHIMISGASPGFGRGGQEIFFSDLEICMSQSQRFASGVRGHAPPPPTREIFLKWCNLVRFGVYLDQILSLKISKITIFYIKNLNIYVEIHINYSCTHMLGIEFRGIC